LSYRLIYPFDETGIRPDLAKAIFKKFGLEFGSIISVPVNVQFLKKDRTWTTVDMFFDTGAVISLLSGYVGEEIGIENYVSYKLFGISKKEECMVPVRIARVKVRLIDLYGNMSPELDIWAAFAEETVPHVLGMKDIINKFKFESNPKEKKLYLTWKNNS